MHYCDFDCFWKAYPRKVGKLKAQNIWRKLTVGETELVMRGLLLWKQTWQWQQNNGIFVPYASTFLAQQRWADEPWTGAFDEQT